MSKLEEVELEKYLREKDKFDKNDCLPDIDIDFKIDKTRFIEELNNINL